MKTPFFAMTLLGLTLLPGFAQEATPTPTPTATGEIATWRAILPGGPYRVALSAITAVSQHEYSVEAAARVTEVNVSTRGAETVRFYYIEPNVPQAPGGVGQSAVEMVKERAQEAVSRAGGDDAWSKVVKNYPVTTHARTVEYRLSTKESLIKLFESVQESWVKNRSATFKP